MAEKYDVVVVGAGHNGLMAAAYLAKAGVNVCVVEGKNNVGGGVFTDEITVPGFKHDVFSTWHGLIYPNPVIQKDELRLLSKFGLEYITPDTFTGVNFDDGTYFTQYRSLDKTCEGIAKFSQNDAEAYRKFHDLSFQLLDMLLMRMYNPTPSFGQTMAMIDSSPAGRLFIKALLSSAWDIAEDWFESDKMRIVMTRFSAEQMINPFTKGTGLYLFLFIPLQHKYGSGFPVGGSGMLSEALAQCLESLGGTIKLSNRVKEFGISGGKATGVLLDNGEEIEASKAVLSTLNIKQVFPDMVSGSKLPDDFIQNVKGLKHSGFSALNQHLALKEAPIWKNGFKSHWLTYHNSDPFEFQHAFQAIDNGIPRNDVFSSFTATQIDPTRAPKGNHTMYLYSFAPYALRNGGPQKWDDIEKDVADDILGQVQNLATNMGSDNILGRAIHSPLFYERNNATMLKGDICQIGTYNMQMFENRPFSGWHNYRTPVDKLYMIGASTHPGPGVFGGARAGVQVVMEDLGINFGKVIN
ncbi:MAG: NAD(P)/FAD-dependent oxidoreductase [Pseudomonadota bacterium]